jgi:putative acetyltransferase
METDRPAIWRIVKDAFRREAEADLINRLRQACLDVISLVAELEGNIVGHILFSPVTFDRAASPPAMGLAPMAVAPSHQRSGIGSALVRRGIDACREAGNAAVIVVGHPDYYPRFGFQRASRFGLSYGDVPDEAVMALELTAGALAGTSGAVRYHDAIESMED